jgi:hypothetical protein
MLRLGGMCPKPIVEGASMRRFIVAAIACLVVAAFAAVPAAATSTGNRGQPSQECGTGPDQSPVEPPGFTDSAGFENAEGHYAAGGANGNPAAVSQYDVACFQLSSHSG